LGQGRSRHPLDCLRIGHVGLEQNMTGTGQRSPDLFGCFTLPVKVKGNTSAGLGKGNGRGPTDASGSPGNQYGFALKIHLRNAPFPAKQVTLKA
jgi:hypothetical protein